MKRILVLLLAAFAATGAASADAQKGGPTTLLLGGKGVLDHPITQEELDRVLDMGGAVAAIAWLFRSTYVGLNLEAAGTKPAALDAAGVSVTATRSSAVMASVMGIDLSDAFWMTKATLTRSLPRRYSAAARSSGENLSTSQSTLRRSPSRARASRGSRSRS